jgi:hypothetical protein
VVAAIREQAIQTQHQRILFAQTCREIADQSIEDDNVAMAVLNYRRAALVAPNTEAGQAAARAIGMFQESAEAELQEVNQLIKAEEFVQAIRRLDGLRRDYSWLPIAPKIEQARRRVLRLRETSDGVANVEPRIGSDRAAKDPPSGRVVESAQPQDARAPARADRGSLAAIHKLAKLTPDHRETREPHSVPIVAIHNLAKQTPDGATGSRSRSSEPADKANGRK